MSKSKKVSKTAKPATNGKDSKPNPEAQAYAAKLQKEYGSCDTIRGVTQKYPSLTRAQVLQIAEALKINKFTASRQFFEVRSGHVQITF